MADGTETFLASGDALAARLGSLGDLADGFGDKLSRAFARGSAGTKSLDGLLRTLQTSLVTSLGRLASVGLSGGATSVGRALQANVTPFAQGGVVAAPTYFPLGQGLGLMGERGAEAILPLARGADGRLGVRAAGGERPVSVHVHIATPDPESFRRSEAQVSAALARAVARGRRAL